MRAVPILAGLLLSATSAVATRSGWWSIQYGTASYDCNSGVVGNEENNVAVSCANFASSKEIHSASGDGTGTWSIAVYVNKDCSGRSWTIDDGCQTERGDTPHLRSYSVTKK